MAFKKIFVRAAYNYDTDEASNESGLHCPEPTLTKQEFAEEVDINTIVRRFGLDGKVPEDVRMPVYADYTNVHDFQSAMNAIALANESFDAMPARVRSRFHNDPEEFVQFCLDDKNKDEAAELGLVSPEALAAKAAALVKQNEPATITTPAITPTTSQGATNAKPATT